jgi:hypothetical protein
MSIVSPLATGQAPSTITRSSPIAIAPLATGQSPQTVTPSPPLAPAAGPTALAAADIQTNPQPINQNGTSGTLVNTIT